MQAHSTPLANDIQQLVNRARPPAAPKHKLSRQQMTFFLAVAERQAMGERVNMTKLRRLYPQMGRSVERSYVVFLAKTRKVPIGLEWLCQVRDPWDLRVKYFELTPTGQEIVAELVVGLAH